MTPSTWGLNYIISNAVLSKAHLILRKAQPFVPYHRTGPVDGWDARLGPEALTTWRCKGASLEKYGMEKTIKTAYI